MVAWIAILTSVYDDDDDIELNSNYLEEPGRHLNCLKKYFEYFPADLDKTEVIVFNITQPCAMRWEQEFFFWRGNGSIHMILHIYRSDIHRASILPARGCLCLGFSWICNPWCPWKKWDQQLQLTFDTGPTHSPIWHPLIMYHLCSLH